jgi:hypothetical protein
MFQIDKNINTPKNIFQYAGHAAEDPGASLLICPYFVSIDLE